MDLPAIASAEAARVHGRAGAELDLLLADLATWVDVDTPGGDLDALDGLARVLALEAERYGLEPELVETPGGLALHATLRGSGTARVALLGHHDTVFPMGTAAARPFRRDGERCYGPGVADMKGGVAVALHTARLLADGPRPFGLLEVVSVPDEESRDGGPPSGGRLLGMDAVLCLECGRRTARSCRAARARAGSAFTPRGGPHTQGRRPTRVATSPSRSPARRCASASSMARARISRSR